jgi:hypothetical protein
MGIDLLSAQPFEICSIRPPTENSSLTFRLTRNCHRNRCASSPGASAAGRPAPSCPVYVMLAIIDGYLALSGREKLEYSVKARVSSFYGQYDGLSRDVYQKLEPRVKGGSLDVREPSDEALMEIVAHIRGKLMP